MSRNAGQPAPKLIKRSEEQQRNQATKEEAERLYNEVFGNEDLFANLPDYIKAASLPNDPHSRALNDIVYDMKLLGNHKEKINQIVQTLQANMLAFYENENTGYPLPKSLRNFLSQAFDYLEGDIKDDIKDSLLTLNLKNLDSKSFNQLEALEMFLRIGQTLFAQEPDEVAVDTIRGYHQDIHTELIGRPEYQEKQQAKQHEQHFQTKYDALLEKLDEIATDNSSHKTGRKTSTRLTGLILSRFLGGEVSLLNDNDKGWFGRDTFSAFSQFANRLQEPNTCTTQEKLNSLLKIICYYMTYVYTHAETEGTLYNILMPDIILDLLELGADSNLIKTACGEAGLHSGKIHDASKHLEHIQRLMFITHGNRLSSDQKLDMILSVIESFARGPHNESSEQISKQLRLLTLMTKRLSEKDKPRLQQALHTMFEASDLKGLINHIILYIIKPYKADAGKLMLFTKKGHLALLNWIVDTYFDGKNSEMWAKHLLQSDHLVVIKESLLAVEKRYERDINDLTVSLKTEQLHRVTQKILSNLLPNDFRFLISEDGDNLLHRLINAESPCREVIATLTNVYPSANLLEVTSTRTSAVAEDQPSTSTAPNPRPVDSESSESGHEFQPDFAHAHEQNIAEWLIYRFRLENNLMGHSYRDALIQIHWENPHLLNALLTKCMHLPLISEAEISAASDQAAIMAQLSNLRKNVMSWLYPHKIINGHMFDKTLEARCNNPEIDDDCEALRLLSIAMFGPDSEIDVAAKYEEKFSSEWQPPNTDRLNDLTDDTLANALHSAKIEWSPKSARFRDKNARFDTWSSKFQHDDPRVMLLGLLLDKESSNDRSGRKALLLKEVLNQLYPIETAPNTTSTSRDEDTSNDGVASETVFMPPRTDDDAKAMIDGVVEFLIRELLTRFQDGYADDEAQALAVLDCLETVLVDDENAAPLLDALRAYRPEPAAEGDTALGDMTGMAVPDDDEEQRARDRESARALGDSNSSSVFINSGSKSDDDKPDTGEAYEADASHLGPQGGL